MIILSSCHPHSTLHTSVVLGSLPFHHGSSLGHPSSVQACPNLHTQSLLPLLFRRLCFLRRSFSYLHALPIPQPRRHPLSLSLLLLPLLLPLPLSLPLLP